MVTKNSYFFASQWRRTFFLYNLAPFFKNFLFRKYINLKLTFVPLRTQWSPSSLAVVLAAPKQKNKIKYLINQSMLKL